MPDVSALPGHVGPGDQQNHRSVSRQFGIVGHEGPLRLDHVQHGVAAITDFQGGFARQGRSTVAAGQGQHSQTGQGVDLGQNAGRGPQPPRRACHQFAQLDEQLVLQLFRLFLGGHHLLLVLFQLGRDVPFRILQCLFADVVVRNFVAVRVGDLQVVTEDLVVTDFQAGNARLLDFVRLVAGNPLFAAAGKFAQLVQPLVKAVPNHAAVAAG